jgi:hypothetical protein
MNNQASDVYKIAKNEFWKYVLSNGERFSTLVHTVRYFWESR